MKIVRFATVFLWKSSRFLSDDDYVDAQFARVGWETKVVAEGTWSFVTNRLAPRRIAEERRRRALSLLVIGALAGLSWLAVIAVGLAIYWLAA
jgi:hypothetical protein